MADEPIEQDAEVPADDPFQRVIPPPSPADRHAPRVWKAANGTYQRTASFVSATANIVKIKQEDGTIWKADLDQLSQEDRDFVDSLRKG